ncbi:MAG TPA: transcriptional repressor [Bradyrhizobium sp.]|jgi:Fur family transcriptional regulator, ferric uptake regulator|nr:transcriptional repressor [Bradyrhizobium sp.]
MLDLARNGRAHARSAEPAPPAAPDIMELCFAANVVCTPAMYAVLRAVVDAGNLPTACEIHRHAATRRPSLTLGSTYRLLTKLVGAGVLTYHGLGDGMARYGVQETRHSGHLIDVDDGRIEEISNEELVSQLSRVAEELGFKLVRFRLVLYGKLRSRERKAAGKGEGPVRRRLNGGGSSPAP